MVSLCFSCTYSKQNKVLQVRSKFFTPKQTASKDINSRILESKSADEVFFRIVLQIALALFIILAIQECKDSLPMTTAW
jgi:hypothetical protein